MKRAHNKRSKEIRKAREYVYNFCMRSEHLVSDTPTYHFGNFKPDVYWTRTWVNTNTKIKVIRARFIRGDLIEVIHDGTLIGNWVDQSGIGINDFVCTPEFTVALLKGDNNAKS
jgi:hypothetical protein